MKISTVIKSLCGAAVVALPLVASAESNVSTSATGIGALTTVAHVNFTIVVAKTLYLRVGTGSAYSTGVLSPANATIDTITFTPAVAAIGNGTAIAGTGGDLTNGVETAAIVANGGSVALVATTGGALSNGNGGTIPYTQISTTAAAGTFATLLNAPVLANGASNTVNLTAVGNAPITADAQWTYKYLNAAAVAPGTYGTGTAGGNGQVTYTATMP